MSLWTEVNELHREDLIDLLYEYDKYLETAREEDSFSIGWVPVCLAEFYEIEFAALIAERSERDQGNEEGGRPEYKTLPKLEEFGVDRRGPGQASNWTVGDVLSIAADLTEDEAYEVLVASNEEFDANYGINWETLGIWADEVRRDRK